LPQTVPIISAPEARFVISWWGREIHLWQLRQTFGSLLEAEEDGDSVEKNHKLLKTIVVKGEASITSVVINPAGTLLVVATTAETKAFALSFDKPTRSSDIEITQVALPEKMATTGATIMKFSPANNILCLVQDRARIMVSQITYRAAEDGTVKPVFSQARTVPRKLRVEGDKTKTRGRLGFYDRGVKLVEFSQAGTMLAIADLAGYVDTWVLQAPKKAQHKPQTNGDQPHSASSDSEDDDDEDDDEDAGPRFVPTPAKLIPRLAGQPLVLSFTNSIAESGDDALLVMTSDWNVILFHPHEGMIAPWSRRNPRSCVPYELSRTLDVIKGVVWVGSRAWFYGNVFVGMIDFSKDLPLPKGAPGGDKKQGVKRKRGLIESGAGRKLKEGRLGPRKIQHATGGGEQWKEVDQDAKPETNGKAHPETTDDEDYEEVDDDDDGGEEDETSELALIRQQYHKDKAPPTKKEAKAKSWWVTYRYRPILGIVPLGKPTMEGGKLSLEAALIERPKWDIDLGEGGVGDDARDWP
jgi:U3 small nucleolar RNA-associated protein 4